MLRAILSWLTGPLTHLGSAWVEGRQNVELQRIEREAQRDLLSNEMKKAVLENDALMAQYAQRIMQQDAAGGWRTSWIRPVTAGISIIFWVLLMGSQIEVGGNGIIPLIFHVPPGNLGVLYLAFPAGVLATFYITRPFEKLGLLRRN